MPKASVALKLLQKHATGPPLRCVACKPAHLKQLNWLLDYAIKTATTVSVDQIRNALSDLTGYEPSSSALRQHLHNHDRERFDKLNLQRR